MSIRWKVFTDLVEEMAPLSCAFDWDNSGPILVTHPTVSKVLVSLDVTDEVLEEAREGKYDTILSHHPLLFRPVKRLSCDDPVTGRLLRAAQMELNLYAAHTSYDCAPGGSSFALGEALGLGDLTLLQAEGSRPYQKIAVCCPREEASTLRHVLHKAGAGELGRYSEASFTTEGEGRFRPGVGAAPAIGQVGTREKVEEVRIEVLCPAEKVPGAVAALKAAHSYEEPAIDVYPLASPGRPWGPEAIGTLPVPMTSDGFAAHAARVLGCALRMGGASGPVHRVACAAGADGEALYAAAKAGADVLITGEAKHHLFYEAKELGVCLLEAGHYATEKLFAPRVAQGLQNKADMVYLNVTLTASQREQSPYRTICEEI